MAARFLFGLWRRRMDVFDTGIKAAVVLMLLFLAAWMLWQVNGCL